MTAETILVITFYAIGAVTIVAGIGVAIGYLVWGG